MGAVLVEQRKDEKKKMNDWPPKQGLSFGLLRCWGRHSLLLLFIAVVAIVRHSSLLFVVVICCCHCRSLSSVIIHVMGHHVLASSVGVSTTTFKYI